MRLTLSKSRESVRLGQELGRGGEGAVFVIAERSDQVAKIYSRPPESSKVEKLVAMCDAATPTMLKIAAWPVDIAIDNHCRPRGFIMPIVSARRDIHELYSPKSRAEAFPQADFRFLVHVATNIARAFAVVHEYGHVIGDVNHGNVLVGPDGTVMLIDCDSFQVRNATKVFTCDVGVPLFTAPELQGLPFRGLLRTVNHDCFGLAILLFHLLFMGRHPFAGRYSGVVDMPIDRAIREYRFAYGPDRALHGMDRPTGTIQLESMGSLVARLFIAALGRVEAVNERPDARAWIEGLEHLKSSLRTCSSVRSHHFAKQLVSCPWCEVEQQTGVRLFGQRIKEPGPSGAINVGELWRIISMVPDPGEDPLLPSQRTWRRPANLALRQAVKILRMVVGFAIVAAGVVSCSAMAKEGGIIWALLSYGLAYAIWPHPSPQRVGEADMVLARARANWESALARWMSEASREAFIAKLRELHKAREEIIDFPNERHRRLAKLQAERETRQRYRYLDRFRIDRASIRGIGLGRTAMLAAYGIETAADIERRKILQIPGFGPALTTELLSWRRTHERNFRFNPNDPEHDRDIAAMDRDLEVRRQALLAILQQAPTVLRRLSLEIKAAQPRLMPLLEQAWVEFKTAEARRSAV